MSSKKKSNQNSSKENENKKSDPNEDNAQSSLTVENQNIARTLSKKNAEISILKKRIKENLQYNAQMQSELFTLKKFYSDSSKLRRELDVANEKNQQLEFEIENLNKKFWINIRILLIHKE